MTARCFKISPGDNVATLLEPADAGLVTCIGASTSPDPLFALESIMAGHKLALVDLPAGAAVVKSGLRIGHCTQPVARGAWVHLHNLASDLDLRSGGLDLHTGAPTDTTDAYV